MPGNGAMSKPDKTNRRKLMKAIVQNDYGSPDVLKLAEAAQPAMKDNQVLVRVKAVSINAGDVFAMRGNPWLIRLTAGFPKPKNYILGWDMAGVVEAAGSSVTQFRPGDEVYASCSGALAEYVSVAEDKLALKPANLTFEQAAAIPTGAITALKGLRDVGKLQPGQKVLINGASGGVGTFAVQIAKALGAEVTGVCSTGNVDLVRSIGADHVIDYTREDFTRTDRRYDLLLDVAGSRSWSACRRVLNPQATLVIVGAPKGNRLVGPLSHIVKVKLAAFRSSQKVVFFIAKFDKTDMAVLADLLAARTVVPVIDRRYELAETADAFRYLGDGHARGKIVLAV